MSSFRPHYPNRPAGTASMFVSAGHGAHVAAAVSRSRRQAVFHEWPPSIRILTWILIPFLTVHVVLATISGYRAIVQVYDVRVDAPGHALTPGDTLMLRVATSGRAPIDAEVILEQGEVLDTLAVLLIPDHTNPSYDPRTIRASKLVVLTPAVLERFRPGPATLRAVGNGRSQWLRVPPPVRFARPVVVAPQ